MNFLDRLFPEAARKHVSHLGRAASKSKTKDKVGERSPMSSSNISAWVSLGKGWLGAAKLLREHCKITFLHKRCFTVQFINKDMRVLFYNLKTNLGLFVFF